MRKAYLSVKLQVNGVRPFQSDRTPSWLIIWRPQSTTPRYCPARSSWMRVLMTSMGCRQAASATPPREPVCRRIWVWAAVTRPASEMAPCRTCNGLDKRADGGPGSKRILVLRAGAHRSRSLSRPSKDLQWCRSTIYSVRKGCGLVCWSCAWLHVLAMQSAGGRRRDVRYSAS